jgi:hypothetical protein
MSASPTDGTYIGSSNYNRFNYYHTTRVSANDKVTKVKKTKPIPKKPKTHIFDIKDLDLKEE